MRRRYFWNLTFNVLPWRFITKLYSQYPTLKFSPVFVKISYFSTVSPSSALLNFQFSSPFRVYLGGTHFHWFYCRQCSNHALTCKKLYKSGTVTKVQKDMITQWSIERKDQLDSCVIFIDTTLDPSSSLPSTFSDALRWETHIVCET